MTLQFLIISSAPRYYFSRCEDQVTTFISISSVAHREGLKLEKVCVPEVVRLSERLSRCPSRNTFASHSNNTHRCHQRIWFSTFVTGCTWSSLKWLSWAVTGFKQGPVKSGNTNAPMWPSSKSMMRNAMPRMGSSSGSTLKASMKGTKNACRLWKIVHTTPESAESTNQHT